MGEDIEDGGEQQTTADINHDPDEPDLIFIGNNAKNIL